MLIIFKNPHSGSILYICVKPPLRYRPQIQHLRRIPHWVQYILPVTVSSLFIWQMGKSGMYMIQYNLKLSLLFTQIRRFFNFMFKEIKHKAFCKIQNNHQLMNWITQYQITVLKDQDVLQIGRLWFWPIIVNVNLQTMFLKLPHSHWKNQLFLNRPIACNRLTLGKRHTIYHKRSSL